MKALILFYSLYGHVWKMAEAVAKGVEQVPGASATLRRVPETLSPELLQQLGGAEMQQKMAHIPVCTINELTEYDAIIFGTPTRFGNMCGQMRQFLDGTGGLWAKGALIGKVGSVFVSTATQHGGQESTITSFHLTLLHHGMVVVGLPYSFAGQTTLDEVCGGSPYGAGTLAAGDGSRQPSTMDLAGAEFQGKHVAGITAKLCR